MSDKTTKDRVKEIMDDKGISVAQLSRGTGIPSARIYKWFKDGLQPKSPDEKLLKSWIDKIEQVPHETKKQGEIAQQPEPDENNIALITARNYEKLINTNSELAKAVLEQRKISSEAEKKITEIALSTEVLQILVLNYHEFWIDQQQLPNGEALKRSLRKKVPLLMQKLSEARISH